MSPESTWVESESESESIRPESESTALESESTEVESESESESTRVESESGLESGLGLGLTHWARAESGLAPTLIHAYRWKINIASNTQKLVYQKLLYITHYTPHTCTKHTPDSLTIIHLLHPLTPTPTPTHSIHLTSLPLTTLCIHIKLHLVHSQHPPHPPPTHPPLHPHPFTLKLICTYFKSRRLILHKMFCLKYRRWCEKY